MDRQPALAGADHRVGEAVFARRAEVGVEVVAAVGVDVGDRRGRVAGDRRLRDVLVPGRLVGEGGRAGREGRGRVGEDLAGAERRVGADRGARPGEQGERASSAAAATASRVGSFPPCGQTRHAGQSGRSRTESGRSRPPRPRRRPTFARPIARRPTLSRPIAKPPIAAAPTARAPIAVASPASIAAANRSAARLPSLDHRSGPHTRVLGAPAPDPRGLRSRHPAARGRSAGGRPAAVPRRGRRHRRDGRADERRPPRGPPGARGRVRAARRSGRPRRSRCSASASGRSSWPAPWAPR